MKRNTITLTIALLLATACLSQETVTARRRASAAPSPSTLIACGDNVNAGFGNSTSMTATCNIPAGGLAIIMLWTEGTGPGTFAITDSAGNTWPSTPDAEGYTYRDISTFSHIIETSKPIVSGVTTVSASLGIYGHPGIALFYMTSPSTNPAFDVGTNALWVAGCAATIPNGICSGPDSPGYNWWAWGLTATTNQAIEMVLVGNECGNTILNAGPGYTGLYSSGSVSGGNGYGATLEYKRVTSTGTQGGTVEVTGQCNYGVADGFVTTYKAN